MNNSIVDLIGVYRLNDDDIDYEYGELLNPENAQNAYLVEMVIGRPFSDVDVGKITQEDSSPRENWQAPYDEVFLNEDGTDVVSEKEIASSGFSQCRFAFFFHYIDFEKPLITPYGNVELPSQPEKNIPARLKGKIKYLEP